MININEKHLYVFIRWTENVIPKLLIVVRKTIKWLIRVLCDQIKSVLFAMLQYWNQFMNLSVGKH